MFSSVLSMRGEVVLFIDIPLLHPPHPPFNLYNSVMLTRIKVTVLVKAKIWGFK